ncbi:mediator of RNA polymerase II transcription subunit 18-like [Pecten maximus]|uniref:mediator of RNA polymerase II transcription subunit 18-like n=1 Tax=Pecten maximus TaxID=6579 RepID=UPI0014581B59|nr:mediator of RNA polymerase II transcription subunit 18-like [Pecten maximus]
MDQMISKVSKFAPTNEFLLQGSIMENAHDVLLHRLRGLCDNSDSPFETFTDHEMFFSIKNTTITQPLNLRVRHSLVEQDSWQVRYAGMAEMGDKNRSTMVRHVIDCSTSDNIVQFLNELGFRMDHEFVIKGFYFHKGRMKVTVSKIYKMNVPSNTENLEPFSTSSLVELSVVTQQSGGEGIAEDMKSFSEQLKPLVQLEKVDHRRLQNI